MPRKLTPPERVQRLRKKYGSHDKLAKALGTTRQTVIRWEGGFGISPKYAERLAKLDGSSPEVFRPPLLLPQFRSMYRQVQELSVGFASVRGELDGIRSALEEAGIEVPGSP